MDRSRSEGKRTLRYKEKYDDDDDDDEEEEEELGEKSDGDEYGTRKRTVTDLYNNNKRGSKAGSSVPPSCQVESCESDLSDAKKYHRRHKVCEYHSMAPSVLIGGQPQRFCQQCSRFHELSKFDDSKRSCRSRLAGHNERRRKNATDYHGE